MTCFYMVAPNRARGLDPKLLSEGAISAWNRQDIKNPNYTICIKKIISLFVPRVFCSSTVLLVGSCTSIPSDPGLFRGFFGAQMQYRYDTALR